MTAEISSHPEQEVDYFFSPFVPEATFQFSFIDCCHLETLTWLSSSISNSSIWKTSPAFTCGTSTISSVRNDIWKLCYLSFMITRTWGSCEETYRQHTFSFSKHPLSSNFVHSCRYNKVKIKKVVHAYRQIQIYLPW